MTSEKYRIIRKPVTVLDDRSLHETVPAGMTVGRSFTGARVFIPRNGQWDRLSPIDCICSACRLARKESCKAHIRRTEGSFGGAIADAL